MGELSIECRRVPDFNRACVLCMSAMKGSHVEAGRECTLDKIALLE